MSEILVKNKRTYKGPGIYIGRPSIFGNPFAMKTEADRADVIERYHEWLKYMYQHDQLIHDEIHRLVDMKDDIILICWCAPKPCHGDVIKEAVLSIRQYEAIRAL